MSDLPVIVRFDTTIDAIAHTRDGGTSLFVWNAAPGAFPNAPSVFKKSRQWGYLKANDKNLLTRIARSLGVRKVFIHREDRPGQHVDLCGKPLARAIEHSVLPTTQS